GSSYSSSNHYWTRKFNEYGYVTNPASNTGQPYIMVPLFTADEASINRAEAYVRKKNFVQALQDINQFASVRIENYNAKNHRVSIHEAIAYLKLAEDDGAEALLETVLQFTQLAFITEGTSWLDILRHRIPVVHNFIDFHGTEAFQPLGRDDNRR